MDVVEEGSVRHPTLSAYYPRLLKLGGYLKLEVGRDAWASLEPKVGPLGLEDFLSETIVAIKPLDQHVKDFDWRRKWGHEQVMTHQELVERALSRITARPGKPERLNVLAAGYYRPSDFSVLAPNEVRQGLESRYVNSETAALSKSHEWSSIHEYLGTGVVLHLFSSPNVAVFVPIGNNSFIQLCGQPLSMIESLAKISEKRLKRKLEQEKQLARISNAKRRRTGQSLEQHCEDPKTISEIITTSHEKFKKKPNDVVILRNRMFYGKRGWRDRQRTPAAGLPINHFFNTAGSTSSFDEDSLDSEARNLLRYIFPREHRLHNVFTTPQERTWWGDTKDDHGNWYHHTRFKNYIDRTEELEDAERLDKAKTPKRMKGRMLAMMMELLRRHKRCRYHRLRDICCPSKTKNLQKPIDSVSTECNTTQVNRYVRFVNRFIFPEAVWGSKENAAIIDKHIHEFIRGRSGESFSVHYIMQGFKVNDCEWLCAGPANGRIPVDEATKRRHLVEELIYWYFDGFLVPLLKTAFYITETSYTKKRTTYYRHDDWQAMCAPFLKRLKSTVYEKVDEDLVRGWRHLKEQPPHATIRLLPKLNNALRPICNLGKRIKKNGPSINESLESAHLALTWEKRNNLNLLKSCLLGVYEMYNHLKPYKARLLKNFGKIPRLYFVKTDIKAAFDTIHQDKLLEVLMEIFKETSDYRYKQFVQFLPISGRAPKLYKKRSIPEAHCRAFRDEVAELAEKLCNAVFLDRVGHETHKRSRILNILNSHITRTYIKFGKDYYIQKQGIPQGSRVSSLLCSYFYGHMELHRLAFTDKDDSLLLRMTDDFLFVTPRQEEAVAFLETMGKGSKEYGCQVALEKSMCNFAGAPPDVTSVDADRQFPYCGTLIDPKTLDVRIDISRSYSHNIRETFKVEVSRKPGVTFTLWLKRMLENYNHIFYNDTSLSSVEAVCANIFTNFALTAMRTVNYLRHFATDLDRYGGRIYEAMDEAIQHTSRANRGHTKWGVGHLSNAQCSIRDCEFIWIARLAFVKVFEERKDEFPGLYEALYEDLQRHRNLKLKQDKKIVKHLHDVWDQLLKIDF